MRFIVRHLSRFLFFAAVLVIVVLPVFKAFCGPVHHHAKHQSPHLVNKLIVIHQQYLEHGLHDVSWEFIKKRHLSAPPATLKIKSVFIISLLFGLFFNKSWTLPSLNSSRRFFLTRKLLPIAEKYIFYRSFLL